MPFKLQPGSTGDQEDVSTNTLQIGDSAPVSAGPVGDQGEYRFVGEVDIFIRDASFSTTSTSWTSPGWGPGHNPLPKFETFIVTNGEYYFTLLAEQRHSGSIGSFRLSEVPESETQTDSQYSIHRSSLIPMSAVPLDTRGWYSFEAISSDGTEVNYSSPTMFVYEQVV